MEKLTDYIITFENVISPQLCDDIIAEYDDDDFQPGYMNETLDYSLRKNGTTKIDVEDFDNKLYKIAETILHDYAKACYATQTLQISFDTGYNLNKYNVGDFIGLHTDTYFNSPRQLTSSIILNDGYEGGEFALFDRELVYDLKKGDAIMFPSTFMYPHEVMPVTKGTRYSIVTWFV